MRWLLAFPMRLTWPTGMDAEEQTTILTDTSLRVQRFYTKKEKQYIWFLKLALVEWLVVSFLPNSSLWIQLPPKKGDPPTPQLFSGTLFPFCFGWLPHQTWSKPQKRVPFFYSRVTEQLRLLFPKKRDPPTRLRCFLCGFGCFPSLPSGFGGFGPMGILGQQQRPGPAAGGRGFGIGRLPPRQLVPDLSPVSFLRGRVRFGSLLK